jgi:putative SOS response-associated peptidase YedK
MARGCTIITTAANDFMRETHSRMPVVLDEELARELTPEAIDPAAALAMLVRSESADTWTMRSVSRRVGDVRNDDASLVAAIASTAKQLALALTFE